MKIAALGDIHSNHYALEACLERIDQMNIKTIAFLGDYISDCPYPEKTISLLKTAQRQYNTFFVRGNREDYMIAYDTHKYFDWKYGSRFGSLLYSYEHLASEELDWFRRMPVSIHVKMDGLEDFEICHGALNNNRDLLLPETAVLDNTFRNMKTNLLLCAHSHRKLIMQNKQGNKMVVNGGSVGGSSIANFTVIEYTDGGWTPHLVSVTYDVESAVNEFYESGLIEKANVWARSILNTLQTGRDYAVECLRMVEKLKLESTTEQGEEYYWERAAEMLGI